MLKIRTRSVVTGVLLAGLFLAHSVFASTGFVDQPLWISPEAPKEGDFVTLSAVFRNGEPQKLSGTVLFYDSDVLLARRPVVIPSNDVGTASVSFSIKSGDHVFSATMESLEKLSGNGVATPLSVSVAPVHLDALFVTKSGSATGAAALALKASSEAAPILDKVNQVQDTVVSSIPDSVKGPVGQAAASVEDWRASEVAKLSASVETAKANVAAIDKRAAQEQKKTGSVSPSTKYVDGPLAEVKLFLLKLAALIFSEPVLFYIVGIIFVFLVVRFLVRRISKAIRTWKQKRRTSKIPKAPRV